jgi:hypothetical protein
MNTPCFCTLKLHESKKWISRQTSISHLLILFLVILTSASCRQGQSNVVDQLPDLRSIKEEQELTGNSLIERLSYVTQLDNLNSTGWDEYRCSASAAINCYLYMGGSWQNLVSTLELPESNLTYANVHHAQEKLYVLSGGDSTGMLGQYYAKWDNRGNLTGYNIKKDNLLTFVFENLNMYAKPILPLKLTDIKGMQQAINEMYHKPILPIHPEDLRNKKKQVEAYFRKNPQGAIFMGVNENSKTGETLPAIDERISSQNHYVMCVKIDEHYYELDTWRRPGQKTLTKLTDKQVDELLFNTHNMLLEMYFK